MLNFIPIHSAEEDAMPEKTVTEQIAELLNVEFPPLPDPPDISINEKVAIYYCQ